MKILHLPYCYAPDPMGGTEVYVAALCRALGGRVHNIVAAPGTQPAVYDHEGVRVHRFPVNSALTQEKMFTMQDPIAAQQLGKVLDQEKPDVVHFHSFTPATGPLALAEVKRRGLPAVATYHTATFTCARSGTLMRWGREPCDGEMKTLRCAACFLHGHGMPEPVAMSMAMLSSLIGPIGMLPGLGNAARGVLRSWRLTHDRHAVTRAWLDGMSRVVALSEWTRQLLLRNGVPAAKLCKVRHGLDAVPAAADPVNNSTGGPLRMAFLGRLDPLKGLDLVVDALCSLPDLNVTLDIYTVVQAMQGNDVGKLLDSARRDARLRVCSPVTPSEVVSTLRRYDALLVPSRCLETGPLVVLEAFAAGVPVIGSRLGGIAEWVTDEKDGLLVPAPTLAGWTATLRRLAQEPDLLPKLRSAIQKPRLMSDVAADMLTLYQEVV